jgi:hypothetical protein
VAAAAAHAWQRQAVAHAVLSRKTRGVAKRDTEEEIDVCVEGWYLVYQRRLYSEQESVHDGVQTD